MNYLHVCAVFYIELIVYEVFTICVGTISNQLVEIACLELSLLLWYNKTMLRNPFIFYEVGLTNRTGVSNLDQVFCIRY